MKNPGRSLLILLCTIALPCLIPAAAHAVPPNDDFVNASVLTGVTGVESGNNVDATQENPSLVYPNAGSPECKSIWYEWTPPVSGLYYFNTFGTANTTGGTLDTVLAVFTGTDIYSLTPVTDNDDFPSPLRVQSRLSFLADTNETYHIAIDIFTFGGCVSEIAGGYTALNWGLASSIPSYDNFAIPYLVTGDSGTMNATNINTTPEVNEPNHFSSTLARSSIWLQWQAPVSGGIFVVDAFGSDFDTIMAVYTGIGPGTSFSDLTKIIDNDDADFTTSQSRVAFTATPSETYYIAIDGYLGAQGNVTVNWQRLPEAPPNDNFAAATVISDRSGTTSAYTFLATTEAGEPYHGDAAGPYASIWFTWTAPFTGRAVFDTFGSDYDTTMAAYTGASVDALTKLAENDDAGTGIQSEVTFPVIFGTTYYIAVDGFQGAEGNVVLNWRKKSPWILFIPAVTGGARP